MSVRTRYFSCITYIPTDELQVMLDNYVTTNIIRDFAYIYHDKDVDKGGKPVTPHSHLLLYTYDAKTFTAVQKMFKHSQNTLCQQIKSDNIYNYLTHTGFEDKFEYSETDIVSNNLSAWQNGTYDNSDNSKVCALIQDIHDGLSEFTLMQRYGRDYILNRQKYRNFAILAFEKEYVTLGMQEYFDILDKVKQYEHLARMQHQTTLEEVTDEQMLAQLADYKKFK